jgi:hypothetical protein
VRSCSLARLRYNPISPSLSFCGPAQGPGPLSACLRMLDLPVSAWFSAGLAVGVHMVSSKGAVMLLCVRPHLCHNSRRSSSYSRQVRAVIVLQLGLPCCEASKICQPVPSDAPHWPEAPSPVCPPTTGSVPVTIWRNVRSHYQYETVKAMCLRTYWLGEDGYVGMC